MNKEKPLRHSPLTSSPPQGETLTDEELAAMATAIHLYLDSLHDHESGILTIKRQPTDWNNHIQLMREWPQ